MFRQPLSAMLVLMLLVADIATADAGISERKARALERIANTAFREAIHITSEESDNAASGSIYALIDRPFDNLQGLLEKPEAWCDITIMHMNIKSCVLHRTDLQTRIDLYSGRMYYIPPEQADRHAYFLKTEDNDEDYFRAGIHGPDGPFGTRNYRINIEIIAIDETSSLIHLSYSLEYTSLTRWVQKIYFATAGRHRIGFSSKQDSNGEPIRGLRGMIERNTMRFYLALQSWLEIPSPEQDMARFRRWHALTEQYPDQLREQTLETYLDIKRREFANQQRLQRLANQEP